MKDALNPELSRRSLLAASAGGAMALSASALPARAGGQERKLPNILWLTSEDNNPYIGAYGDRLAHTPHIDALAKKGILYRNVYSNAPVCAPSRFGILTGVLPEACAPANHMRAVAKLPDFLRTYPEYLRSAGYYCTNNVKTDYNCDVDPARIWDDNGPKAHYANRPEGKPFMAVFNTLTSHESRLFTVTEGRVKPQDITLPAYLPDTPAIRQDYASYYNLIEKMDGDIGQRLAELEASGLAEDTIVFYYSDNGGVLPRSKRYCHDRGLRCAMVVYVPPKWAHLSPVKAGTTVDAPVSFIDLAPTLLSLAGMVKPQTMHGAPFLGHFAAAPKDYAFGMRNRMNESVDFVRTVTDGRYRYIRNYMPHRPCGQHQAFSWLLKSYQDWDRLHREGRLTEVQARFFQPRAFEEFYDLDADPDEVDNRIADPKHRARVADMRRALDRHMIRINDNGFIPEGAAPEGYVPSRAAGAYPLKALMALGAAAARRDRRKLPLFRSRLTDADAVTRYWAAMGLLILGEDGRPALAELQAAMRADPSPHVRVAAAEAVANLTKEDEPVLKLAELAGDGQPLPVRLLAVNALTYIGNARPALAALKAIEKGAKGDLSVGTKYLIALIEGSYDPAIPLIDMSKAPAHYG